MNQGLGGQLRTQAFPHNFFLLFLQLWKLISFYIHGCKESCVGRPGYEVEAEARSSLKGSE